MHVPTVRNYHINDIFYSPQGEGVRAGTMNLFVRFSGCNLQCAGDIVDQAYQPICDTEFVSHRPMSSEEILARCQALAPDCHWIIFTGGEPALQLDAHLMDACHTAGYSVAIETNGTRNIDALALDWVCVSPKVAEHALQQRTAHEVKYVRAYGQGIPKTSVKAEHYVLSPATDGDQLDRATLDWCVALCREHPQWRLSVQLHKLLGVR